MGVEVAVGGGGLKRRMGADPGLSRRDARSVFSTKATRTMETIERESEEEKEEINQRVFGLKRMEEMDSIMFCTVEEVGSGLGGRMGPKDHRRGFCGGGRMDKKG